MLFSSLGMNHTYMKFYDAPRPVIPGKGLSHVYYGDIDNYGVERIVLDEIGYAGFGEIWGHSGSPNSFMFYSPQQNVTIIGTLNQALPKAIDAYGVVIAVLSKLKKHQRGAP